MLSHLFGGKVWPRGKVTYKDSTTPHINSGTKHGGMVEGNAVGDCLGDHIYD